MKKMMMAVAGLAMAVVMTGCGGSPKSVAEKFADAIVKKDVGKAFEFYDDTLKISNGGHQKVGPLSASFETWTSEDIKNKKKDIEEDGKAINDEKYECEAVLEQIYTPSEKEGCLCVNGKKFTGEVAEVRVQFVKGKERKPDGIIVDLIKLDGSWKVVRYHYVKDKFEDKK